MSRAARILIVDDEPNVRLVFRTALESAGYRVDEAGDGDEALARLGEHRYDLALLDLRMPRLDGMETLRKVREQGRRVPVVIVTAHGSIPDAVAAMKLGAIDFLTKPLTPEALRRAVAEVIDRHAEEEAAPPARLDAAVTAAGTFAADLRRAKRALNNGWLDEAEVFLKQAIALNPQSAEAHNLKGILHEARNEHDDSLREYKAALKADRRFEPARHNLKRYYERFTFGRSDVPIDLGEPT
ncbi:MAG TPA: response regulator [Isosphaeraceae bacterium]|jgi:DNA-binding response OmpR family regulator|nr:response regulator [Isosphaeraceae bacterium]